MGNVRHPGRIPGPGMYVVGVDILPGQYVRDQATDTWTRYPGGRNAPVIGTADTVFVEVDDLAFETRSGAYRLVGPIPAEPEATGPVFDPALPPEVAGRLRAHARRLPQLVEATPQELLTRALRLPVTASVLLLVGGELVSLVFLPVSSRYFLLLAVLTTLVVFFVDTVTGGIDRWRAMSLATLAKQYRTQFVTEFDDDCERLLRRARTAISKINDSAVVKEDLLDSADNAVTLAEQEWEIAQTLAKLTATHPKTAELAEVFDSTERRVTALEEYARHVREIDLTYLATKRLAEGSDQRDLLAETARDDLAIEQIKRLDTHAEGLRQLLKDRLAGDATQQ